MTVKMGKQCDKLVARLVYSTHKHADEENKVVRT